MGRFTVYEDGKITRVDQVGQAGGTEFPPLTDQLLNGVSGLFGFPPKRGAGLATGRAVQGAGERRAGEPRSEFGRWLRHNFNVDLAPEVDASFAGVSFTPMNWDWGSFSWGLLGGAIAITVVGGIVLFFTWPYVIGAVKAVPVFSSFVEGMVSQAKAVGILG